MYNIKVRERFQYLLSLLFTSLNFFIAYEDVELIVISNVDVVPVMAFDI